MSRARPLWLAQPTRFAGVPRQAARWSLALLGIALLLAAATARQAPPPVELLHPALVESMRHGGTFHDAVSDLTRSDAAAAAESGYPPALAVVEAAVGDWGMLALLALVIVALLWVGWARMRATVAHPGGRWIAGVLLMAGAIAGALLHRDAPHTGFAALLIALAMLLRDPGRWIEAAAVGCVASIIDPAVIPALLVFAAMSSAGGSRREALGWLAGAGVAGMVLAAHLLTVTPGAATADDAGILAVVGATAFPGLPAWLAAPALLLGVMGWSGAPFALGLRVLALLAASIVAEALFGLHAAAIACVLLPAGLAFAPDVLADLARAALDRRRITVTRIAR